MARHRSAADIARCDGYAWNLRDKLGKGSYGDVYRGWNNKVTICSADGLWDCINNRLFIGDARGCC